MNPFVAGRSGGDAMLQKDDGVVLKVGRSGETSLLVTLLARRAGKIRLLAKGVLGPKRPTRGVFEPGNHLEIVFYFHEGRTLYYLKEASSVSPPQTNRDSLPHLATVLAALELLDQVCYPGSADEAVLDLALEYVQLEKSPDPLFLFLAFEARLLQALGVIPQLDRCPRCGCAISRGFYSAREGAGFCREHAPDDPERLALSGDVVAAFDRCVAQPLSSLSGDAVAREVRKDLGKIVHWTYTFHVQGYSLPKSLNLI